jgi:hypothetical protein
MLPSASSLPSPTISLILKIGVCHLSQCLERAVRVSNYLQVSVPVSYVTDMRVITSDAVPDDVRHDGLHSLSAMVLGIANMGQKVPSNAFSSVFA